MGRSSCSCSRGMTLRSGGRNEKTQHKHSECCWVLENSRSTNYLRRSALPAVHGFVVSIAPQLARPAKPKRGKNGAEDISRVASFDPLQNAETP